MSTLTKTSNSLALKLGKASGLSGAGKAAGVGVSSELFKFLLLLLVLPISAALLGVWLVKRKIASVGRNVRRWIVTETVLILLVTVSAILLGFALWTAYDHLQERHVSIAAGSRTSESYTLARALKAVTARHYPRIRITILAIEGAAGEAGILEKGVVGLAFAPGDLPAGKSARSVAVLANSPPQVLLARHDVDERVVYALTHVLTQFSADLAAAAQVGKAAPQPLTVNIQKPVVKAQSDAPLHPGAAAFYDRDKTPFVFRHAWLIALVSAELVLLGLWTWQLIRRARRKEIIETISFSPPAGREPWTFSKILRESMGEPAEPLPVDSAASGKSIAGSRWRAYFRRR